MKTNKRLIVLIVMLCMLNVSGCTSRNQRTKIKSGKDITFFVTTDVHYLAKELTDGGEAFQKFANSGDGRQLNYVSEIMDGLAYDIKKKKADFLIISGDLTTNGEKESHTELAQKLKDIEAGGTSVFVIPGNHDILNPFARGFKKSDQYKVEYVTEKAFKKIYDDFGYNEAVSRDTSTLSYLAAPSEDLWLLMLDTAQYKSNLTIGQPQLDGQINSETLDWIKKCSDMAKEKHAQIIAVLHHNLLDHSETLKEGYTLNNNKEVLQVFESCGIQLALSGHTHIQDIKSYNKEENVIHDVVTASVLVYPQKYGVIKFSPLEGYDYNTNRVDVEGYAREKGLTDKNLINFKDYSEAYFKKNAYEAAYKRLLMGDYDIEQAEIMAETSALIRTKYFEGSGNFNREEILKSKGFELWRETQSESSVNRLLNMLYGDSSVNNKLQLSVKVK